MGIDYKEVVGVRDIGFDMPGYPDGKRQVRVQDFREVFSLYIGNGTRYAAARLTPEQARFIARQLYRMARRVEARNAEQNPT